LAPTLPPERLWAGPNFAAQVIHDDARTCRPDCLSVCGPGTRLIASHPPRSALVPYARNDDSTELIGKHFSKPRHCYAKAFDSVGPELKATTGFREHGLTHFVQRGQLARAECRRAQSDLACHNFLVNSMDSLQRNSASARRFTVMTMGIFGLPVFRGSDAVNKYPVGNLGT
jgi:hypothetical protein